MTRAEIRSDLYTRLTSRKLWLCLLLMGLAVLGYHTGQLDYAQFQSACLAAVGVFSATAAVVGAAEAVVGAAKPRPVVLPDVYAHAYMDPDGEMDADERAQLLVLIKALGPANAVTVLNDALYRREYPHES